MRTTLAILGAGVNAEGGIRHGSGTRSCANPAAQKIIDAAEKLFYECSIHAVGVEAIAAAAGVTKRTLYDRFDSKDAVIEAYLLQRHQRWLSRFDQRLAVSAPPRTGALFDSYFEDVADSSRGCAFLNAAAELPRNHPAMKVVHEHKRCVRKRLETLVSEDAPQLDAQSTADHLFLILEGRSPSTACIPIANPPEKRRH